MIDPRIAPSPRQLEILQLAGGQGRVVVEELAARFQVTPQTIRRDLNQLCAARRLARIHGGAMLPSGIENVGYGARQTLAAAEKQRIARLCARHIPNDCSLFINIGTTTEAVAAALRRHRGLLVITNNLNVASLLLPSPEIEIIVAGGLVRRADGGIVGEATADFVSRFKVDYAVIGASAIDEDGTLLDFDYREVHVAQAIIANARSTFVVADHSKFVRSAPVRIADVGRIAALFTDRPPADRFAQRCAETGTAIHIADGAEPS